MSDFKRNVLFPVPRYGFDPTEVAVPWGYLHRAGIKSVFATPDGKPARADECMVLGKGLGLLAPILKSTSDGVAAYRQLEQSSEFLNPISYEQIEPAEYEGLVLGGGHDKGMREYLDSKTLQSVVVEFFNSNKIIGAICHGTLLAGRSVDPKTQKSVLWGRRTTGLTRNQELIAFFLTRAYLGDYYRTYPELDLPDRRVTMADELTSFLRAPADFLKGPGWPLPLGRDSATNLKPGFTVRDGNYLSARWPGDAHRFSTELLGLFGKNMTD